METTVTIVKTLTYIGAYSARLLECLLVIFFVAQYFKPKSYFKSAYYVILNIGYIEDLIVFINNILPLTDDYYNYTNILHQWHNSYFLIIWNAILCINRCTAIAMPIRHDKIWTPTLMIFISIFMIMFPFLIDGYQFFDNFKCSPSNMLPCLSFRKQYYYIGTILSIVINIILISLLLIAKYRSRKSQNQKLSTHAKIEKRLIHQAIFSSIFQLIYFNINYFSSISTDTGMMYIWAYSASFLFHCQHYAVMISHFVFSPSFRQGFFNFWHLGWLLGPQGKVVMIKSTSKSVIPNRY